MYTYIHISYTYIYYIRRLPVLSAPLKASAAPLDNAAGAAIFISMDTYI